MQSDAQNFLFVPVLHTATYGDQNFHRLAQDMWNKLPTELRLSQLIWLYDEVEAFKKKNPFFLKIHFTH